MSLFCLFLGFLGLQLCRGESELNLVLLLSVLVLVSTSCAVTLASHTGGVGDMTQQRWKLPLKAEYLRAVWLWLQTGGKRVTLQSLLWQLITGLREGFVGVGDAPDSR